MHQIEVYGAFGPGLFDKTYVWPFLWAIRRGLNAARRVSIHIEYRGRRLAGAYVIDILVEELIVADV